ncbi:hypothetical protein HU200_034579 [Digitaria exilis]|uniref:KIB1-4 beta-propeller domain-containing protein n=1 Tax=Digitaria exilis TaxID=1010633 RepID=A0A835EM31_9POAL|nr:hypothetical protein HU200_034579 [Digitaria exilis]
MEGAPRSWSNIPLELAGLVLGRLHAHVDRVNFAAVCTNWRTAAQKVSLPPPLPLLALKDGSFYSMPGGEPLRFPGCGDDFVTVSGNWLVYKRWNCLLFMNPFSRATMTLPAVPGNNDNMDFVVVKLVVSLLMVSAQDLPKQIFDIAFYREKLYAVNYDEELFALEINVDDNTGEPHVARGEKVISGGFLRHDQNFFRVLYLVEAQGLLLMVHRMIALGHIQGEGQIHTFAKECEPELAVFEADIEQSKWWDVTIVGDDHMLFLGACSRVVCILQCDYQDRRFWLLDDYKDEVDWEPFAGPGGRAVRKFSCPLPKISWRSHYGCAGAMWLFPSN